MIFQNPWGLLGLLTVAVPVLIHLLGRGRTRVQRFPTLRFLNASRLLPTRRTRINDPLLLALRVAALVAAGVALTQPLLQTRDRQHALSSTLSRAIVIDTSASMTRATPTGERALDIARQKAQQLANEVRASAVLESAVPMRALSGALAWLDLQSGQGEVVILSDFQAGVLDSTDLAHVPHELGVQLLRIPIAATTSSIELVTRFGEMQSTTRVAFTTDRTDVTWNARTTTTSASERQLMLAGANERAQVAAALRAAATLGAPITIDTTKTIAIVYPHFEQRTDLLRRATSARAQWMVDVVARLRSDSMLVAAAAAATTRNADTTIGLVVARTDDHQPVILALEDSSEGRARLLLVSFVEPASMTSAALIAATVRARGTAPPASELDPAQVAESVLSAWQRPPSTSASARKAAHTGASDGRWMWLLALLVLALETWMRRSRRTSDIAQASYDRAA